MGLFFFNNEPNFLESNEGKIIEQAPLYLNEGGFLMFELGISEAEAVRDMMVKNFKNITILKLFTKLSTLSTGMWIKISLKL